MDAAGHVLDRHGADPVGELGDGRRRLALPGHEAMPGIEGEAEARHGEGGVIVEGLDQHAGLGLEAGHHPLLGRVGRDLGQACAQPDACRVRVDPRLRDPGPERDRLGFQDGADVDRPLQEADPAGARRGIGRHQGRLVLVLRIEEEAGPRLDHGAEAEALQAARHPLGLPRPFLREGVEMVDVEGERHAVISGLGDQLEGVVQPVVGGPVGVVGEAERHAACPLSCSRNGAWCDSGSR
ncbi:hypothetical protein AEGHOMDF_1142 [Methylobacterium soli]|nr:hypothetical protein AEGHOMDF_1142 [Methylobacterium soli]